MRRLQQRGVSKVIWETARRVANPNRSRETETEYIHSDFQAGMPKWFCLVPLTPTVHRLWVNIRLAMAHQARRFMLSSLQCFCGMADRAENRRRSRAEVKVMFHGNFTIP